MVQVFTRNNCMACHSGTAFANLGGGLNLGEASLGRSLLDKQTAHGGAACVQELLIDSLDPDNSLLLKLIHKDRLEQLNAGQCRRNSMPPRVTTNFMNDSDFACVASWVKQVAQTETPLPPPPLDPNAFAPADAASALAKAKYLLHGGAPTAEELTRVGGSQSTLDAAALRTVITEWEKTPEYAAKMRIFLMNMLQLKPLGNPRYPEQLDNILRDSFLDGEALLQNLNEQFHRTAWNIVDSNRDFRQVISTREWQVTTALLVALAYADKTKQRPLMSEFEYLKPEDFTDWRTVRLEQATTPINWENSADFASRMRAIPDGGSLSLKYPRVGFFSSPVFLNYWISNNDNQFRLTINQLLIAALGQTFSPGDATPHSSETGIPAEHAVKGTVCYECHRHMDPMRLVFSNTVDIDYRALPETAPQQAPAFSFWGVNKRFTTLDQLATLIGDHPLFAAAWVQKLCQWGNSTPCDEKDPEFKRLATFFETQGYKLKPLIRQFFSSPLFTGNTKTQTHETQGFDVSLSRSNHYCAAFSARVTQINNASGTTGKLTPCKDGILGVVPQDEYARGEVELVQSRRLSLFDAKSIDRECSRVARAMFGSDDSSVFNLSKPVDDHLANMAQYLMGIPSNHARYNDVVTGLRRIYDLSNKPQNCSNPLQQTGTVTCGFAQTKHESLKAAFFAACSSPELIGLGF